jgi:hypothetical protein
MKKGVLCNGEEEAPVVAFAEDLRKELQAVEKRITALGWDRHRLLKEQLRLKQLSEKVSFADPSAKYSSYCIDLLRKCVALGSDAKLVESKIRGQETIRRDLQGRLQTAPNRPRTRSQAASIAASGSKEFNVAIGRDATVGEAWTDALVACLETAKARCGLKSIPEEAKEIMRMRALKRHPKLRSQIRKLS